eukprot:Seg5.3 transcript_id=Seg5.3/GoldUCD/mRNA.D3Y31 product="Crystallin J1C" protein_id=Seg5.3/GoldUCD/D3Y31
MNPSTKERCCAAVIGATVADAAGQPIHWNYKEDRLNEVLKDHENPEFIAPSQNPFYNIETGKQTCYGDQAYAVLRSLTESKGLNKDHMSKTMYEVLGPSSDYEKEKVNSYKFVPGSEKINMPITGPWRHKSIKDFLKHFDEGGEETGSQEDTQIDSVTRIAPIVALYAGKKEMLSKVEQMVRVTQNNDIPVAFAQAAARILEYYILNGDKQDALEHVMKELKNPERLNPNDLDLAISSHISKVIQSRTTAHKAAVSTFGRN